MNTTVAALVAGAAGLAMTVQPGAAASPPSGLGAAAGPASFAEHQAQCAGKDGWSDPAPPVRIFANVYDVGTCGIVVLLVAGPAGHVVIDGATAEAAPQVSANIERLGFRLSDVKVLLSSHEHLDHAGGLAELMRRTGARLMATPGAQPVLESGTPDASDPQAQSLAGLPAVKVDHALRDGELVTVGALRLTAHLTPGHSPGGASWTWTSCQAGTCHSVAYADSLSAVSSDSYRFSDHPAYVATFKATMARVGGLPCDLLITPHPGASRLYERLAGTLPLVDRHACAAYAAASRDKLDQRLASEAVKSAPAGAH